MYLRISVEPEELPIHWVLWRLLIRATESSQIQGTTLALLYLMWTRPHFSLSFLCNSLHKLVEANSHLKLKPWPKMDLWTQWLLTSKESNFNKELSQLWKSAGMLAWKWLSKLLTVWRLCQKSFWNWFLGRISTYCQNSWCIIAGSKGYVHLLGSSTC